MNFKIIHNRGRSFALQAAIGAALLIAPASAMAQTRPPGAIWGNHAIWGDQAIWGNHAIWGDHAISSSAGVVEGRLVVRHGDDLVTGRPEPLTPALELDDGTVLALHFGAADAPNLAPGSRIRVRGARSKDAVAVAAGGMETLSTSTTTSQAATGPKRVAVVLFNFSNDTGQPYTPAYAAGVAFTNTNSAAAYYAENSWGQLTLSGDVYGWYTIPNSNTSCDYTTWGNSANQAASAAGVNLSAYDYVVYGFPAASSCHWSGIANLPGRYSWLNGAGAMGLRTMAHELGHNFGTHHASSLSCIENGVRVSLSANSANCSASEYGDPFSIMGSSAHEHTNFALGNFGWLQTANTQTVTTSGDYLLKPLELYDPGAVQALRIQRTPSTYLTLEFRQPGLWNFDPFSATDPAVEGVTVRITPGYSTRTQSQLVDTTPATSSFADAPLAVGQTLVDPVSLASITDVGVSPLGATVRISFAPDTSPPSQPGNLTATPLDAGRVTLSWSASSDNASVAGYRVYRNKLLVATVTSTRFTDGGLSPSTSYAYSVVAFDAADNLSTVATAFATTPAADTQPPSAPGNLTATVAKGKKVALSWTAAGDSVGVAGYRIYRDGTPVATTAVTSFTDAVGGRVGAISYYVVAYDAAGNVSAASNSVSVTP